MKSFGRLIRRMRGDTPLPTVAERLGLEPEYLAQVEAGQVRVDPEVARRILQRGFAVHRQDVGRLILGIQLYDLGLRDNDIRQLVIGMIRRELPAWVREELKQLYRRSTTD